MVINMPTAKTLGEFVAKWRKKYRVKPNAIKISGQTLSVNEMPKSGVKVIYKPDGSYELKTTHHFI